MSIKPKMCNVFACVLAILLSLKVPAIIKLAPITVFKVSVSPKNRTAKMIVRAMLLYQLIAMS